MKMPSIKARRWWCYALSLILLLVLVLRTLTNNLGIDPYDTLIRTTGDHAIQWLLLTLAMTPLHTIKFFSRWQLTVYRKPLGLACFTYALVHLSVFLTFDLQFDLQALARILAEKPYVLVGMLGFLLLLVLAITSLNRLQKKMGGKWWKRVHQSIYGISILAILHYLWLSKHLHWDFYVYTLLTAYLMGFRLWRSKWFKRLLTH